MRHLAPLIALLWAAPAAAHGGHGDGIGWTLDASVTVPLLLTAVLYAIGIGRLLARAGRGRGALVRGAWLYAAGWLVLAGALVSPLHEAGERSFTFHMIEHELLMLPAALLLVAARPGPALLWGLPRPLRQLFGSAARLPFWRRLCEPITATAIQAVIIWAWHMPGPFDLALDHEGWHVVQHLCFVFGALLFWWSMLNRTTETLAAVCLFATSMIGGALGALMALSASPWYSAYAAMGMTPFGLSPAEDQQLAGLIMWIPGGLFHLCAALWFLGRWLTRKEGRDVVAAE
ncbi:MAG TPA: cytochrome c oxidase assembly protein [Croceibacterium sp.]|jgi:cytochrome c oxidase assembly factor CtaG